MERTIEQEWPVLISRARTGKTKYWKVRVEYTLGQAPGSYDQVFVVREWWLEGGKHQVAGRAILGKNVGRSNETTPLAQAHLEADAEYKKQLDDGYQLESETIPGVGPVHPLGASNNQTGLLLPMLAHDFTKRGKSLEWPCYAQPKLDGFRCLFNSSIGFWSRGGKPFDQAVDLSHLTWDTQGLTFDGELMLPDGYTFQQTCSAIKKQRPETGLLRYHIFDVVLPDTPFSERDRLLAEMHVKGVFPTRVLKVETQAALSLEDAQALMGEFLEAGYEGLILRNADGNYDVGNRSPDLLKLKSFDTSEFQVLGAEQGVGKDAGTIIFVCGITTPTGLQEFRARPRGTHQLRSLWWEQREELVGRFLTVRHQGFSDEGLPRFPVGIALRDMLAAGVPAE